MSQIEHVVSIDDVPIRFVLTSLQSKAVSGAQNCEYSFYA